MTGPAEAKWPAGPSISPRERINRLENYFWPEGYSRDAWMVVDAARDRRIFGLLLECFYSQHSCLYSGRIAPAMEMVAPYLVQLEYDDEKCHRFLRHAWGGSWGVFLKCKTRMETLRSHLRRFLIVRNPQGKKLLFRYYDPRILKVYLPTCTPEELRTVFGPIESFCVEHSLDAFVEFKFEREELQQRGISLDL